VLEQRPLADVAEIHAHEIELLVRHAAATEHRRRLGGIFTFRVGDR
jgi:hypothetical protein